MLAFLGNKYEVSVPSSSINAYKKAQNWRDYNTLATFSIVAQK